MIKLNVNGRARELDVEPDMPLLWALRDELDVKGPKYGCGIAQCGSCTVLIDGEAVRACLTLAVQADGRRITTVEGLSDDQALSPLQAAFRRHNALQCGFCTPGMVMSSAELLAKNPKPTEADVRHGLEGNICRCTGYHNIVKAVMAASGQDVAAVAAE